jgi:hypothetical protein
MSNLPTAKEFLNRDESGVFSDVDIARAMIEFAKLHVEAALKEAANKADITYLLKKRFLLLRASESWDFIIVDKKSILNAYPLEQIK